ncbi:uncharacterized protein LOC144113835 isoform X2 [Amblyomma americanum]
MLPFRTTGQEGKERAEKLAIIRLVFATVRVTRSATDDEVARALADWLRFSNSRLTAAKFHRHTVGSVATIFSWHQPEPYHLPLIRFSEQVAAANCYHRVGMRWDETSMPNFVNALQQPSLCPLECHIESSRFSIRSLSQVCSALVSSTVESLSVAFIDSFLTEPRHHVHEAIRKNQSIVSLSLQEDRISSGACIFVAKALLENRTVTKLSLRINGWHTGAAETLSEILSKNQTLEKLLLNCSHVDLWCVDVIASGLKENRTLTHFSIFDERDNASCSTMAVDECVDRNLSSWNCAVQFVLEVCISRRRAEIFESLQGMPCFLQRVAAASGKSLEEAATMVETAKCFIRSNYLFITGVVCRGICCYPSGQMQLEHLYSDCWHAISKYLRVSDVIRH